ncbi:MAG: 3-hydroxybutyrate dehydrogenase [Planctomycetota bacterium]|jgi:3-hydroxybutyrate dehydrogenase
MILGYLSGQVALVTGAGRGLGRSIALALGAEGARIALVARSADELQTVSAELSVLGTDSTAFVGDLLEPEFRDHLVAQVEGAMGAVDILVNNAGVAPSAPIEKTTDEFYRRCMEINVTAPFVLCRNVIPGMKSRGRGRIVNIASTAALKGYAYTTAYVTSKHALLGLTRALATEVLSKGITVNAVCPGFADTKIAADAAANIASKTGRSLDDARSSLANEGSLKRLIKPEEVARAVLTLVGPDSDAFSGIAFPVAGDAL